MASGDVGHGSLRPGTAIVGARGVRPSACSLLQERDETIGGNPKREHPGAAETGDFRLATAPGTRTVLLGILAFLLPADGRDTGCVRRGGNGTTILHVGSGQGLRQADALSGVEPASRRGAV